ncbi:MAG TPA: CYTH domain-containing protein [Candidatus Nitrosotenuis sp.]|jgi:uncharacterized protein YjbK|nr:CYTH domain-containing protein [Candidatus Nitrosotenuis sp.]
MSTERELKYRLAGPADYQALLTELGRPCAQALQVNVYFEAPDGRIEAARSVLRLRCEGEARLLTYKRGLSQEEGYFQAREVEEEVDPATAERLLAGDLSEDLWALSPLAALARDLGRCPLHVRGRTENLRLRFPLPGGDFLELDRTVFPGGQVEFEVEVETRQPDQVRAWLEGLWARTGVVVEPQTRTKYERFLASLGQD